MHKKVQVVVFNKTNSKIQVLLLQTNTERGSFWQNITGSVDPGESFQIAANRELQEETGIQGLSQLTQLEYNFHDRWKRDVIEKVYYNISEDYLNEIEVDSSEHQAYRWLDVREVNESHYQFKNNYEAFKHCLEQIESN